jgi:hypothetical protein
MAFMKRLIMDLAHGCKYFILITAGLTLASVASVSSDAEHSDITLPVKDYLLPAKTENIRESLKDPIFVACKEKATPVGKEGALAVCTRYDDISGQTDTVIYDSTDEVEKQQSGRSEAWKTVALSTGTKAPFGIMGFDTENIAGHYYRVVFWKQDADVWPYPIANPHVN